MQTANNFELINSSGLYFETLPNMEDKPMIAETFKGKAVLITGATGFVGKVLLEKVLRSCPGITEVLVLLRPGEIGCERRFADLRNSKIFENIRTSYPYALDKMSCVKGDVTSENLGLDESSFKKISEEVSFVFHCAASVRFDDQPKKIFSINLVGVQNVLKLCHAMKKLEALVHVSTAYSFCNQVIIAEEIYEEKFKFGPDRILEALKWMNKDQLQSVCDIVVQGRPSLYHYSKAMAEIYLSENHGNLPIVIVRPAIVTASFRDPYPGWIDNHNGPTGFIALSSKGIIRTLLVKDDVIANWVPVDIVANTIITAAHVITTERKTAQTILKRSQPSGIPIINCVCPEQNAVTWLNVIQMCIPLVYKYPSTGFYRTPGKGTVTSSPALHMVCKFVSHYLPAAVMDGISLLFFQQMSFVRSFRRMHGVMNHLQHYTTHSFIFTSPNMKSLVEQMSCSDHKIFPIDQNKLKWPVYLDNYVHGVRRFYLQESDSSLEAARSKLVSFGWFSKCFKMTTVGVLIWILSRRFANQRAGILSCIATISKSYEWIGKFVKY